MAAAEDGRYVGQRRQTRMVLVIGQDQRLPGQGFKLLLGHPQIAELQAHPDPLDELLDGDAGAFGRPDPFLVPEPGIEDPADRGELRSAEVIIEFEKKRSIHALGIWEDPSDLPASEFALTCCDSYGIDPQSQNIVADWRLVCVGRGNIDYYHLHSFPPVEARIWRYTVLRAPGREQRCAEIELYEDAVDTLLDSGAAKTDIQFVE